MGDGMDLGIAGSDDCGVQHNGWRRGPKVGHRRQVGQKISQNPTLVTFIHLDVYTSSERQR